VSREDDLEALATEHGWTFSIEDRDDLYRLPFRFFQSGVTGGVPGGVTDVIEGAGSGGRDFVAFDFEYRAIEMGMFAVPETFDVSCAVVALPAVCPELMVSHETTSHWLSHPTHHEVFVHEREDFARGFRITTTDTAFAAAVFDDALERWFLDELPDRDLCFEIAGSWLMCFTHRRDAAQVPMLIEAAIAVANRIPSAAFNGRPSPTP
jgi:hypothetical protein